MSLTELEVMTINELDWWYEMNEEINKQARAEGADPMTGTMMGLFG